MALNTIKIKDGDGNPKYMAVIGSGTEAAPYLSVPMIPEIHIPLGLIDGRITVNKFGVTPNADNGVETDVWDGANSSDNQKVWIAPTAPRVHGIVSSSTDDASGGIGANEVIVYGLPDWDSEEVSETITMNGTTPVNTSNSYVIIHRMKVIPAATSTSINVGTIKAVAATDGTDTAMILPTKGQTLMAIYGIPSTKTALMPRYYVSAVKASTSLGVKIGLRINPNPDIQTTNFLCKNTIGLTTEGTNYADQEFNPYYKISGPAIIKIKANSSADNTEVAGGFDLIVINN